MDNTLQFQQNANVSTANGEDVGTLTRVVMNSDTKAVTHIVVRGKSIFDNKEKLVPIEQIAMANEDQIMLHDAVEDLKSLSLFEEKHKILDQTAAGTSSAASQVPTAYGTLSVPADNTPPGPRYITIIEQNIPTGTVAVKEGAKVITAEGKNVGKIEGIVADKPADQATHLLVTKGRLAEEKKLVPMKYVQWLEEKEVHLSVKKETLKELESVPADKGEDSSTNE